MFASKKKNWKMKTKKESCTGYYKGYKQWRDCWKTTPGVGVNPGAKIYDDAWELGLLGV